MRKNQVDASISFCQYGDQAPPGAERRVVTAYADANNPWEAAFALFKVLVEELEKDVPLPTFGRVEAHTTTTHKRHTIYSPFPSSPHPTTQKQGPERAKRLQAWAEAHRQYRGMDCSVKPVWATEFLSWLYYDDEKLNVGDAPFISSKFLGIPPIQYKYTGYQPHSEGGAYRQEAYASRFEEVVEAMLFAPEKTSIKGFENCYSAQEQMLLEALQEKLLSQR